MKVIHPQDCDLLPMLGTVKLQDRYVKLEIHEYPAFILLTRHPLGLD
jgi:hypothetical protein